MEGVNTSKRFADVIYGWPLDGRLTDADREAISRKVIAMDIRLIDDRRVRAAAAAVDAAAAADDKNVGLAEGLVSGRRGGRRGGWRD